MRFLPLFFLLIVAACQPTKGTTERNVDAFKAVDPFIGTAGHGHTFPGATTPFGMVQLSPDNGTEGWDWCSGYNYIDSNIVGFSHTHMSGTGIGDLYDISFMPSQNASNDTSLATTFDHRNEASKPGYYKVKMDNGVTAELTSSPHVGFHQYTFDSGAKPTVGLDLGFSINWDDQPIPKFDCCQIL
jgi:Putative alpha-1,2-mannosidase